MSRFLITLAAVVIAGAMYVAVAPGSQQGGPTAGQFKALKKEVAKLKKDVKVATDHVNLLAAVDFGCMLHSTVGVAQKGDPGGTFGYSYSSGGSSLTTALDLSGTPTYTLLTLNPDPKLDCASIVGLAKRMHAGRLTRWPKLHH